LIENYYKLQPTNYKLITMILTINIGSASKKYALYEKDNCLFSAHFENEKEKFVVFLVFGDSEEKREIDSGDYSASLSYVLGFLIDRNLLDTDKKSLAVALRIVAPGEYFTEHKIIDEKYLKRLKSTTEIEPIHVGPTILELKEIKNLLPKSAVYGISDSVYHATIPKVARRYGLPKDVSESYGIYRYGYHGLSVSGAVQKLKNMPGGVSKRTIVCHLGSGVSVSALVEGKSVDTSMGFTPLEGIPMGSRVGSIDAEAVLFLQKSMGLSPEKMSVYLNTKSGLKGISGKTSDVRELLRLEKEGDSEAGLAIQMFIYRIRQYLGAYMATLEGLDTIVFTGVIGERSPEIRARVCENLSEFGVRLDEKENELYLGGRDGFIQSTASVVSVIVLVSDESKIMAAAAYGLLSARGIS